MTQRIPSIWRDIARRPQARWSAKGKSDQDARTRLNRGFVIPEVEPAFSIPLDKPIFTIGSCFARNIEDALAAEGADLPTKALVMDYAAEWGLRPNSILNKYNIPSIVQEMAWALEDGAAFDEDFLIEGGDAFVDPHLDDQTPVAGKEELLDRHAQVTGVFTNIAGAQTIVMTLGMTEAWKDKKHDVVLNTAPSPGAVSAEPERFEFQVLSYEDNAFHLNRCVELIFAHAAADARLILTVSPVALNLTFSGRDVIVANSQSKATLVALAQATAAADARIDYFPSYEAVMMSDPLFAWQPDRRHASPQMVSLIVAEFLHRYAGRPKPEWPDFRDDRTGQIIDQLHRNTKKLERMVTWGKTQGADAKQGG